MECFAFSLWHNSSDRTVTKEDCFKTRIRGQKSSHDSCCWHVWRQWWRIGCRSWIIAAALSLDTACGQWGHAREGCFDLRRPLLVSHQEEVLWICFAHGVKLTSSSSWLIKISLSVWTCTLTRGWAGMHVATTWHGRWRRHVSGNGSHCLSFNVRIKKMVVKTKRCQRLFQVMKIVFDNIENVLLEARIAW